MGNDIAYPLEERAGFLRVAREGARDGPRLFDDAWRLPVNDGSTLEIVGQMR